MPDVNDERAHEVCERLRETHPDELCGEVCGLINPDGPAAADLIEAYAARVRVLEEALMPFAALDATLPDDLPDEHLFSYDALTRRKVTFGEVRRARTLLQETNHAD